METDLKDSTTRIGVLARERDDLERQLQRETEERAELDEQRDRLYTKNEELNDQIGELQVRLDEEEHHSSKAVDELKKLQVGFYNLKVHISFSRPISTISKNNWNMRSKSVRRLCLKKWPSKSVLSALRKEMPNWMTTMNV
jgi:predicted nuclease with TOPRIM domain